MSLVLQKNAINQQIKWTNFGFIGEAAHLKRFRQENKFLDLVHDNPLK